MRKTAKRWIALTVCILLGGMMTVIRWDFFKLSTGRYETNIHEIYEKVSSISVETDTANIVFALSNDGKCRVECYEERKAKHSVSVEDDTLTIGMIETKAWYDHIGIHFGTPKITVYLPEKEYESLDIHGSTGDIRMPGGFRFGNADISLSTGDAVFSADVSGLLKIGLSTGNICIANTTAEGIDLSASTGRAEVSEVKCDGNIDINLSTGKINLSNVECRNFASDASTGNITLKGVVAQEKLSISRSTGNVKFDSSDAAEIFVETGTGNVTGSLLTEKIFITRSDTGKVIVPESVTGGKCKIETSTGNIKIQYAD